MVDWAVVALLTEREISRDNKMRSFFLLGECEMLIDQISREVKR